MATSANREPVASRCANAIAATPTRAIATSRATSPRGVVPVASRASSVPAVRSNQSATNAANARIRGGTR